MDKSGERSWQQTSSCSFAKFSNLDFKLPAAPEPAIDVAQNKDKRRKADSLSDDQNSVCINTFVNYLSVVWQCGMLI